MDSRGFSSDRANRTGLADKFGCTYYILLEGDGVGLFGHGCLGCVIAQNHMDTDERG